MRRFTSALLILILFTTAAFSASSFAYAEESVMAVTDGEPEDIPTETEPVVVPPDTEESTEATTPEPTDTTTEKPEPTQTTTKKPEPTETTTKKPIATESSTTKKTEPSETTTKEPVTSEITTKEPAVVEPPVTEEPDKTEKPAKTDKEESATTTKKKPSKTEKTDTDVTTDEITEAVTTDIVEGGYGEKKMFATPLEVVSFILGNAVIISVFVTLFTIARRIVKKYTSGR